VLPVLGLRPLTTLVVTIGVFVVFALLLLRPNVRGGVERLRVVLRPWLWIAVVGLAGRDCGVCRARGDETTAGCRIPEVLVPNFKDTEQGVWTWVLEPIAPNLSRSLADIVYQVDPEQVKSSRQTRENLAQFRDEITPLGLLPRGSERRQHDEAVRHGLRSQPPRSDRSGDVAGDPDEDRPVDPGAQEVSRLGQAP
jgi:hypothetical protein